MKNFKQHALNANGAKSITLCCHSYSLPKLSDGFFLATKMEIESIMSSHVEEEPLTEEEEHLMQQQIDEEYFPRDYEELFIPPEEFLEECEYDWAFHNFTHDGPDVEHLAAKYSPDRNLSPGYCHGFISNPEAFVMQKPMGEGYFPRDFDEMLIPSGGFMFKSKEVQLSLADGDYFPRDFEGPHSPSADTEPRAKKWLQRCTVV